MIKFILSIHKLAQMKQAKLELLCIPKKLLVGPETLNAKSQKKLLLNN